MKLVINILVSYHHLKTNIHKSCPISFREAAMERPVPIVVLLLLLAGTWAEVAKNVPVVVTEEGSISGVIEESVKGRTIYTYYGVPFAKPPVGPLRLKVG